MRPVMYLFIEISVCEGYILEDFTTESTGNWATGGDAYWDPNGWVEMTGTGQGKKGAVYNKVESIASGTASIRFTIKTGNGMNGGADGFAFTIMNVGTVDDLETWINQHNLEAAWDTQSVEHLQFIYWGCTDRGNRHLVQHIQWGK